MINFRKLQDFNVAEHVAKEKFLREQLLKEKHIHNKLRSKYEIFNQNIRKQTKLIVESLKDQVHILEEENKALKSNMEIKDPNANEISSQKILASENKSSSEMLDSFFDFMDAMIFPSNSDAILAVDLPSMKPFHHSPILASSIISSTPIKESNLLNILELNPTSPQQDSPYSLPDNLLSTFTNSGKQGGAPEPSAASLATSLNTEIHQEPGKVKRIVNAIETKALMSPSSIKERVPKGLFSPIKESFKDDENQVNCAIKEDEQTRDFVPCLVKPKAPDLAASSLKKKPKLVANLQQESNDPVKEKKALSHDQDQSLHSVISEEFKLQQGDNATNGESEKELEVIRRELRYFKESCKSLRAENMRLQVLLEESCRKETSFLRQIKENEVSQSEQLTCYLQDLETLSIETDKIKADNANMTETVRLQELEINRSQKIESHLKSIVRKQKAKDVDYQYGQLAMLSLVLVLSISASRLHPEQLIVRKEEETKKVEKISQPMPDQCKVYSNLHINKREGSANVMLCCDRHQVAEEITTDPVESCCLLEEEENAEVNIVNNVVAEGDDEGGQYDKVTRTIAASKEDEEKEDVEVVEEGRVEVTSSEICAISNKESSLQDSAGNYEIVRSYEKFHAIHLVSTCFECDSFAHRVNHIFRDLLSAQVEMEEMRGVIVTLQQDKESMESIVEGKKVLSVLYSYLVEQHENLRQEHQRYVDSSECVKTMARTQIEALQISLEKKEDEVEELQAQLELLRDDSKHRASKSINKIKQLQASLENKSAEVISLKAKIDSAKSSFQKQDLEFKASIEHTKLLLEQALSDNADLKMRLSELTVLLSRQRSDAVSTHSKSTMTEDVTERAAAAAAAPSLAATAEDSVSLNTSFDSKTSQDLRRQLEELKALMKERTVKSIERTKALQSEVKRKVAQLAEERAKCESLQAQLFESQVELQATKETSEALAREKRRIKDHYKEQMQEYQLQYDRKVHEIQHLQRTIAEDKAKYSRLKRSIRKAAELKAIMFDSSRNNSILNESSTDLDEFLQQSAISLHSSSSSSASSFFPGDCDLKGIYLQEVQRRLDDKDAAHREELFDGFRGIQEDLQEQLVRISQSAVDASSPSTSTSTSPSARDLCERLEGLHSELESKSSECSRLSKRLQELHEGSGMDGHSDSLALSLSGVVLNDSVDPDAVAVDRSDLAATMTEAEAAAEDEEVQKANEQLAFHKRRAERKALECQRYRSRVFELEAKIVSIQQELSTVGNDSAPAGRQVAKDNLDASHSQRLSERMGELEQALKATAKALLLEKERSKVLESTLSTSG